MAQGEVLGPSGPPLVYASGVTARTLSTTKYFAPTNWCHGDLRSARDASCALYISTRTDRAGRPAPQRRNDASRMNYEYYELQTACPSSLIGNVLDF